MGAGLKWCVIKCRSFGMPMVPVAWQGANGIKDCSSWWRISEKSYSALHWIAHHFGSPHLQTLRSTLPEQARLCKRARVCPGLCATSSDGYESVFSRHHAEDTLLVLLFFLFCWQSCIEELIPPSGVPCERVTFSVPSVSLCRFLCHLCTTHFLLYSITTKSVPLSRRGGKKDFSNPTAIIEEIYMEENPRRVTFSKDLRI